MSAVIGCRAAITTQLASERLEKKQISPKVKTIFQLAELRILENCNKKVQKFI